MDEEKKDTHSIMEFKCGRAFKPIWKLEE